MTPSAAPQPVKRDLVAAWSTALHLYPIYVELAREFVIESPAIAALEDPSNAPDQATVEAAMEWLQSMDSRIEVHQLRQFLQTSSIVDRDGLALLLQHLLANAKHTDSSRDKIDFLLVQYFSLGAPTDLDDNAADMPYVAQAMEPVLGKVELKSPVWLNALDRVLESARRCQSLDELLHGGVLEQGRRAKAQAGDLFYLPVALVAFTRFGYLMRRVFFRLMLADLNNILDGLTELEERGVETIDCRRAQFSQQEPIVRLRMICQSWKVMFQAEYSSGQPLRMLVDLRASVDAALGRGAEADGVEKAAAATAAAKAGLSSNSTPKIAAGKAAPPKAAPGKVAAAPAPVAKQSRKIVAKQVPAKPSVQAAPGFAVSEDETPEFDVSAAAPDWNPDEDVAQRNKK